MSRIYLTSIDNKTAFELKNWENFTDPKLAGYNYGGLTDFEIKLWQGTISMPNKKYFAVKRVEDDRFIGFIGLKNINPFFKRAKLGIVFDPNFVSKGYGYEAVSALLEVFFDKMNYNNLYQMSTPSMKGLKIFIKNVVLRSIPTLGKCLKIKMLRWMKDILNILTV